MSPPSAANQSQGLVEEPHLESPPSNTFILKVGAKKDSTEFMLKALITRTHAPKPLQYHLKPTETTTDCFIQYQTVELLKEAEAKIRSDN